MRSLYFSIPIAAIGGIFIGTLVPDLLMSMFLSGIFGFANGLFWTMVIPK